MAVDDAIYVARPDLIGLEGDEVDFSELDEALAEAARSATEITILAGYYKADALVALCHNVPRVQRRRCKIRIAIGLDATALIPRTWEEMRSVDRNLHTLGF